MHVALDLVILHTKTRQRFAAAKATGPTLFVVKRLIVCDWPNYKAKCPIPAKPIWSVRNNLSEAEDLLLYGNRLAVQASLHQEVMANIHDGHFGEVKCILLAKSSVYWSGCDYHIRNMVASCLTC